YTRNLSDLLAENTPLFIKTYGQGGLATSSIRGAGASHTIVTWNGIKINSPMLGQLDFSLIPASFLDEAEVFYGAGSIRDYSGALGGSVNLINEPDWNNRLKFELSQEFGSYHSKSSHFNSAFGNSRFQSQTRFFYNASENNFTFLNTEISQVPVIQERENASFSKSGIIQEFYIRPSSNHFLTARFWYQSNNRHIPEPMVVTPVKGNENQKDHFLRSQINWKYYSNNVVVNTTAAWLNNFLNYSNRIAGIDSENRTQTITGRVDFSYDIFPEIKLNSGVSGDFNSVRTENYRQMVERKHFSAYVSAEKSVNQRLKINIMARQDVYNGEPVPLIPSIGIDLKLFKEKDLHLKANISRNYHKPTLNDQYWYPGGNPDLNEEKGNSGEFNFDYSTNSDGIFSYQTGVTAYRSKIDNWIQWQPGKYGYWEPANLKEVLSKGMESFLSCRLSQTRFLLSLGANYAFTLATNMKPSGSSDMSENKQLVYVPVHKANTYIKIKTGEFKAKYSFSYIGKRYISSDNSLFIPSYRIGDLSLSYTFKKGSQRAELNLSIGNIWDVEYQAIVYHPMPGRSYYLSIRYFLNKNNK
ncbi:MAG: TonB-dependent receptor plug domain-containing protein, partial [Bacteroidales bacterium]|nr:TonB-dependent receptor plug domain-containing protein [Bacteroidales bacterium]